MNRGKKRVVLGTRGVFVSAIRLAMVFLALESSAQPPYTSEVATITLVGLDSYGRPLAGCSVFNFYSIDDSSRTERTQAFKGLVAEKVPFGNYLVSLKCYGGTGASSIILVDRPDQFFVISSHRHVADYAPGRTPLFTVKLAQPRAPNATVWAKLIGVYLNEVDIERVRLSDGTASFIGPQPGRYILMLLAPGKVLCRAELLIDLLPSTVTIGDEPGCPVIKAVGVRRAD